MLIAISALVISLITAFTSIYSAFTDRTYARASAWPRLEIYRSHHGEQSHQYVVTNNGTGPALVKYAKVTLDGKPLKNWNELVSKLGVADAAFSQSHIGSIVLPAQQKMTAFDLQVTKAITAYYARPNPVSIELCYCSIYDECWLIDRSNQPTEVAQCKIDEAERFLQ
jgi:hypothetical protein